MNDLINMMFDNGVFKTKYKNIVEIYPRKAMNTFAFDAALHELSKTHEIIKVTSEHLRAFKMGVIE